MADFTTTCENAVHRGGTVLMGMMGRAKVREKGRFDLVTEADLASQDAVRRTILEAFPDHEVVGEEDQSPRGNSPRADYRWIVDPLDGTTNYVHGVPHFSVSLALERLGELVVAGVYDPTSNEYFSACRNQGAYLNGVSIHVGRATQLAEALVAVGFPNTVTRETPDLVLFNEVVPLCQALRRTGSAALNLAYVAAGRFDAAWSYVSKTWDFAAGALLVREAGGIITRIDGKLLGLEHGTFLAAATSSLHKELAGLASHVPSHDGGQ